MQEIKLGPKESCFLFDSVNDLLENTLKNNPKMLARVIGGSRDRCEMDSFQRGDWTGRAFKDVADFKTQLFQPWEEGMQFYTQARKQLEDLIAPQPIVKRRRARFNDDDGDEVCNDRLRAGGPYWRRTERIKTHGAETVSIVVDLSCNWKQNWRNLIWRGMTTIVLAEHLERVGYRADIWVGDLALKAFAGNAINLRTFTNVKRAEDVIDVENLINVTSTWFLRVLVYAHIFGQAARFNRINKPSLAIPETIALTDLQRIANGRKIVYVERTTSLTEAVARIKRTTESLEFATL